MGKRRAKMTRPPATASRGTLAAGAAVLAAVLIAASIWGLYARVLDAPFLYDDHHTILASPDLLTPRPLSKFLGTVRPLTYLSYAFSHQTGGPDPRAYHVFDVILHCLNALLVILLGYRTLRHTPGARAPHEARMVALAAALLFASHPLQTQVVAYISGHSGGGSLAP